MELDENLHNKITALSDQGNSLVDEGKLDEAIKCFKTALSLVPHPQEAWEASTWLLVAIGDTYFFKEDYSNALNFLFEAQKCPDGIGNPFILFRIGQSFFETNEIKNAKRYLLQAYMIAGDEIFMQDDPKYLKLVE